MVIWCTEGLFLYGPMCIGSAEIIVSPNKQVSLHTLTRSSASGLRTDCCNGIRVSPNVIPQSRVSWVGYKYTVPYHVRGPKVCSSK